MEFQTFLAINHKRLTLFPLDKCTFYQCDSISHERARGNGVKEVYLLILWPELKVTQQSRKLKYRKYFIAQVRSLTEKSLRLSIASSTFFEVWKNPNEPKLHA